MLAAGLPDEARKAVKTAFDAMSTWRTQIASNEKNIEAVIDKIAAGARAMGWPQEIVDATRTQIESMTTMQLQLMDQVMDAWEEQIKSPNPSSAMLSKLKSLPPAANSQMNPFGLYMQVAQQWQRAWTDAMAPWMKH
jgi:hypothetical protein